MSPEEARGAAADLVARSCAAQGLPERVTDPGVLGRVAAIIAAPERTSTLPIPRSPLLADAHAEGSPSPVP